MHSRTLYVFANSFLTIGLLALVAMLSRTPLVFPPLGRTALVAQATVINRIAADKSLS